MYSSAVLAVAIALSAPAFAAPLHVPGRVGRIPGRIGVVVSRDTTTDASGASIFSTIAKAIPDVVSGISDLFGGDNNNQQQKRELEALLSRALVEARSPLFFLNKTPVRPFNTLATREFADELYARDASTDASGASIFSTIFKAIPDVVSGISDLFGGDNNNQQKREVEDLVMRTFLTRAAADDASGASIFSIIAKAIPDVVSGISDLFGGDNNNQQKRDVEHLILREVFARAAVDDQSGASIFSTIAKAIPDVVSGISDLFGGNNNQQRDLEHIVMRELVARAAADDQSGASIFSTIAKAIPDVVSGISDLFGGDNNQKREVEHLLLREVFARAAADEQSGASIFSTIAKAIPDVVSGISDLFGGDNNNQQKREVEHLVMRTLLTRAAADDASGASIFSTIAKAIPDVIKGVSDIFGGDDNSDQQQSQKREIGQLMLREVFARAVADDQSGASIFSTIAKFLPDVIKGVSDVFGGDSSDNQQQQSQKRELLLNVFARAAATDASGASIFSTIAKFLPDVIKGVSDVFGGDSSDNSNQQQSQKRELLLREVFERAAATDASGASIFSTIAKFLPDVVEGVSDIFGGNNNNNQQQQQRREVAELLAREYPVARSLNELD
ncbi:hypothetical protein EUX98_g8054 [Antrodiella citrinella]|uniref:Uncharacterized protein n=1 Tax=Antrodiella citrinella TaxID=2447956 RepID=A0A4S4MIW3_9APHY|nr:hypothetical protein EUX98_g8054 [Antrodiella citrinella]